MTEDQAVKKIQQFFKEKNGSFVYKNQKGNIVTCKKIEDGIVVDCLQDSGYKQFLPWGVFWQAVHVIIRNGGSARKGSAQQCKLGDVDLPFNSVEGGVANVIYGKKRGDWVFQRISPIAHILSASGYVLMDQASWN